ncbi:MAG: lipopolysaccharide biosynthesis protein [Prevotellaceae bacterium]|nr:lipopolysaccharide biosynthesis protein [Prevotellaceae bacterium]
MSLKTSFVHGIAWTSFERFLSYFVQFLIGIILARLLSPEEYGILGVLLIFTTFSQVFIDSGFGNALIYFNDKNRKDLSTVFVFNLFVSSVLYTALYLASDAIEDFFKIKNLSVYLNVITITLLFNSFQIAPVSILKIDFKFKQLAVVNTAVTIISGGIGIMMAYCGYGIWALIAQTVSKSILGSLCMIIISRFILDIHFYKESFRKLYGYSVNMFGASMLTNLVDETTSFVIGKFLTPANLGIFSRAKHFMMLPYNTIGSILFTVLFPSLASVKNDREKLLKAYDKIELYMAMISMPLYVYLCVESKDIILMVLGEKWKEASVVLAIMCVSRMFALCAMVTENTLNAIGRANTYFKLQLTKMFLKLIVIVVSVHYGFIYLVLAEAAFVFIQFFITNSFSKKYLLRDSFYQIRAYSPFLLSSVVAGLLTYAVCACISNVYVSFTVSVISYFISYFFLLLAFRQKSLLMDLLQIISRKKV